MPTTISSIPFLFIYPYMLVFVILYMICVLLRVDARV